MEKEYIEAINTMITLYQDFLDNNNDYIGLDVDSYNYRKTHKCPMCKAHKTLNGSTLTCRGDKPCPWITKTGFTCSEKDLSGMLIADRIQQLKEWLDGE